MKRVLLICLIFLLGCQLLRSQTLNVGDIAFLGYNTDGAAPARNDDFTWIALTDIPAGEIIHFTDEGWTNQSNSWVGSNTSEFHLIWTSPAGGISCGTVIHINEPNADGNLVVTGGGTIAYGTGANWNLSAGDQVLAYRGGSGPRPASPFFISGIHGDDGNGSPLTLNATTGWNDLSLAAAGTARSELPPGLTNGVDCISLFPVIGTETDNARYNGTLTGTSTVLRGLINDRTNWISDNTTPYDISPGTYSPSVTCVPTSVNENSLINKLSVFPNPTNGIIMIDLKNNDNTVNYTITTLEGREILSDKTRSNKLRIDLTGESKGVYFLQIQEDKTNVSYKIIKQ